METNLPKRVTKQLPTSIIPLCLPAKQPGDLLLIILHNFSIISFGDHHRTCYYLYPFIVQCVLKYLKLVIKGLHNFCTELWFKDKVTYCSLYAHDSRYLKFLVLYRVVDGMTITP